ncbi:MAG TPA: phosphatidylserine decarboxylase family protein [Candidatus Brocadiia bacterium]|nr:phosphatidylserine decarboxylase family protein [Candidatus Brocadiia bacterium]
MIITRHGFREIAVVGVVLAALVGALCWAWPGAWPAFVIPAALILLAVTLFFRDPRRVTPADPRVMVAPADGKVVEISEADEPWFLGQSARKIAIFMSVLSVHVNRSPCAGRVEKVHLRPGQFLNAMRAEASAQNEASLIAIQNTEVNQPVLLMQIAGLVARRVVCAVAPGDELARGQRIGVVKFGSRAEVYVPKSAPFRWRVKLGDSVRAGVTILGEWL